MSMICGVLCVLIGIRTVLVEHNAAEYRRRVVYICAHVLCIYTYNNNKNNNNII